MAGWDHGGVPVTQMYETQADREQGYEMGSKYSGLMLSTFDGFDGFDGSAWNAEQPEACTGQQWVPHL